MVVAHIGLLYFADATGVLCIGLAVDGVVAGSEGRGDLLSGLECTRIRSACRRSCRLVVVALFAILRVVDAVCLARAVSASVDQAIRAVSEARVDVARLTRVRIRRKCSRCGGGFRLYVIGVLHFEDVLSSLHVVRVYCGVCAVWRVAWIGFPGPEVIPVFCRRGRCCRRPVGASLAVLGSCRVTLAVHDVRGLHVGSREPRINVARLEVSQRTRDCGRGRGRVVGPLLVVLRGARAVCVF